MTDATFVYVTYIASTSEKVWDALTRGEITRQYWGHDNVSDWKPGSKWRHMRGDQTGSVIVEGQVLENDRPRRLVLTWGDSVEADKAKRSRVAFDLEAIGDMVRLTVTHDELTQGSEMQGKITRGWPRVLSSLKSLLETGRPLNTWAQ